MQRAAVDDGSTAEGVGGQAVDFEHARTVFGQTTRARDRAGKIHLAAAGAAKVGRGGQTKRSIDGHRTGAALIELRQQSAVGAEGQTVGTGEGDRAGRIELVEHKPGAQILGAGISAGLVKGHAVKRLPGGGGHRRGARGIAPGSRPAPIAGHGAAPEKIHGQAGPNGDGHGGRRGVAGAIVDEESKTVRATEIGRRGVGQVGRGAGEGAVGRRANNRVGQGATAAS